MGLAWVHPKHLAVIHHPWPWAWHGSTPSTWLSFTIHGHGPGIGPPQAPGCHSPSMGLAWVHAMHLAVIHHPWALAWLSFTIHGPWHGSTWLSFTIHGHGPGMGPPQAPGCHSPSMGLEWVHAIHLAVIHHPWAWHGSTPSIWLSFTIHGLGTGPRY